MFFAVFLTKRKKIILWKTIALMQLMNWKKKSRNYREIQCDVPITISLYVYMNMQATSIYLPRFDRVSIWRALEKSCTFVSWYFWCTIWRTPLTAFPATCQTWRRIIISFCILFSPASNSTLHWEHYVRETDRKGIGRWDSIWQLFYAYIKQLLYASNAKTKSRRLVEYQNMWWQKPFLLHDLQFRLNLIF